MRQPDIWSVSAIKNWNNACCTQDGRWINARPEPHNAFSFRWRFKIAWKVLTGEYDALRWDN